MIIASRYESILYTSRRRNRQREKFEEKLSLSVSIYSSRNETFSGMFPRGRNTRLFPPTLFFIRVEFIMQTTQDLNKAVSISIRLFGNRLLKNSL